MDTDARSPAPAPRQTKRSWLRVLDHFSGNPLEDFLDIIRTHHLIRCIFFGILLIEFWGNWNMVGAIIAIWAIYEGFAILKRLFRN